MNATKLTNSDLNMAACKMFENVLEQVKSSNLNFHLQQSPFSALISLKKSFVKDKSGLIRIPPSKPSEENTSLAADLDRIQEENNHLK